MNQNIDIKDFVGIFDGVFNEHYCAELINFYNQMNNSGLCRSRQELEAVSKLDKDDKILFVSETMNLDASKWITNQFAEIFWQNCFVHYAAKYPVLNEAPRLNIFEIKIQETEIGGGYHKWHCESMDRRSSNRLFAFSLFLNTVEQGGEMEFLYYPRRINALQGRLVLWPAGFTHTHRGNPPISNTKFIATGWIEF